MDIRLDYKNLTNKEEAFLAVKKAITPETLAKFKVSADIDANESLNTIRAKGTGFDLNMVFLEDAVDINLDLSFMLKPFKKKVLETIESMVKKVL